MLFGSANPYHYQYERDRALKSSIKYHICSHFISNYLEMSNSLSGWARMTLNKFECVQGNIFQCITIKYQFFLGLLHIALTPTSIEYFRSIVSNICIVCFVIVIVYALLLYINIKSLVFQCSLLIFERYSFPFKKIPKLGAL